MKNPFKQLMHFFQSLIRKYQVKKRDKVYETVIEKLKPLNDAKVKAQNDLIDEITDHATKFMGYDFKSEFIPNKYKNHAELKLELNKKYLFRMQKLGVSINDQLKFVCT